MGRFASGAPCDGSGDPRSRLVDALYEGALDEEVWARAMRDIAALVGGQGTLLLSMDPGSGAILRDETHGYSAQFMSDFRAHWAVHDIRVRAGRNVPVDVPVAEYMILPRREWERSVVFNEFLKENDAGWFLAAWLHKRPGRFTTISIQGAADRGPFATDGVELIQPLLPHVRRALEIRDRMESLGVQASALRGLFEGTGVAAIMLDAQHRVLDSIGGAADLLETTVGVRIRTARLQLAGRSGENLSRQLASDLRDGELHDGRVILERGEGRLPLSGMILPLPHGAPDGLPVAARWILLVFDPEHALMPAAPLVAEDLGLSPREAEVASLLAAGLALPAIAARLGTRLETVRTQLKRSLEKAGCASQAQLVRRVLSGPARLDMRAMNASD